MKKNKYPKGLIVSIYRKDKPVIWGWVNQFVEINQMIVLQTHYGKVEILLQDIERIEKHRTWTVLNKIYNYLKNL